MKHHAYSYINSKFRTHLRRVHSGHYIENLCQKPPRDEFPAEIGQITGTGFNWVRAYYKLRFGFGNEDLVQMSTLVAGLTPHNWQKWKRVFLTCHYHKIYRDVVWKIFSILSPKLVLEYAEDILSDSRLKNCAKCKGGWCKSVCVERFEIWVKKGFFGKKVHLACYIGNAE